MSVKSSLILLLWLTLPMLLFLRHTQYLQNYYFLYWVPAQILLMVLGAEWAQNGFSRIWPSWQKLSWVAFVPLGLIAGQYVWTSGVGREVFAEGRAGKQRVVDVDRVVTAAQRLLAKHPDCQLVVVSEGSSAEKSRLGLLREYFAHGRVRFMQAGVGFLVPPTCAVYLDVTSDRLAEEWLLSYAQALPSEAIATPEERWRFYELSASKRETLLMDWGTQSAPLAVWADSVELRSMQVPGQARTGDNLLVTTTWNLRDQIGPNLQFGNYVLNEGLNVVTQADGTGIQSADWQTGDWFQMRFVLSLPADVSAGHYQWALTIYSLPQVERLPVTSNGSDIFIAGPLQVNAP
jgi:hypothetical protein